MDPRIEAIRQQALEKQRLEAKSKPSSEFYESGTINEHNLIPKKAIILAIAIIAILIITPAVALWGAKFVRKPADVSTTKPIKGDLVYLDPATSAEVLAAGSFSVSIPAEFKSSVTFEGGISIADGKIMTPDGEVKPATTSGVLTIQGQSGAVTLLEGSGISLTGLTIANDDKGSDQSIYKNIKVGSTTLAASSNNDTLTFAAGDNITLSTDTTNKKITINASQPSVTASGWTDDGTVIRLTTSTDTVGIGTTAPSGVFDVGGGSFVVLSGGNVGIATTAPDEKLSVVGNIKTSGSLILGGESLSDLTGNGITLASNALTINLLSTLDGASSITESFSGLEFQGSTNQLALLQGCTNGQVLKWDDTNSLWACNNDVGGSSGGIIIVQENDVTVSSTADTLDYNGTDFDLTESPSGEINVAINSGIARKSSNETISGNWTFSSATPVTFSNAAPTIAINNTGSLSITDGTNTLLTLSDLGTTGSLDLSGTLVAGTANAFSVSAAGEITAVTNETINGIDISAGTISDATWNGTAIGAGYGGTGLDSSASTGVPTISSGTWSVAATLSPTLGGTGLNSSALTGVPYISSGTWATETTLDETRGGTGQTTYATGDIVYGSASNTLSKLGIGSSNQVLTVSGGIPTWSDVSGLNPTYWDRSNGVVSPKIASVHDLLLGSNATDSAKFGFINVNSGTPTATVSAGTTGATYIKADGTIATTTRQSLTLGDSTTTGNVQFYSSANRIDTSGNMTLSGNFTASGTTGVTLSGAGAGITLSGSGNHDLTASTGTLRIGAHTLNGSVAGNAQTISDLGTLALGTGNVSITGTTVGITTDTDLLALAANVLTVNGSANFGSGNVNITGTTIGLTSDTDLLSLAANALTVNGTLATTGAISAPTSSNTINGLIINAGVLTGATDETINGIDISSGTVSDVVNLTINSGGDLAIGAIGLNDIGTTNITSGASLVGVFDEFANSSATTVQDVLDDLDAAIGAGSSKWTRSNNVLYPSNIQEQIGIGTTTEGDVISSLFVTRNLASGALGKSVAIFNQTENQDILTASASGTTRLTLSNGGNLNIVGGAYQIGGTSVLSSTTLGTNVVTSSLTTVSALNTGSITSGFGTIDTGTDAISGGDITASGTTGLTASGAGAGLTFSGSGSHTISASLGTLQLGAATLTGAIAGNTQTISGLGTASFGTGNVSITGTTVGLTTDTDLLSLAANALTVNGTGTIVGDLAVNSDDLTSNQATFNLLNTGVTTLSLGGAATTLNIGTTNSVTRTINLGTGTGADTINIGTGATGADTITLGANTGTIALDGTNFDLTTAGAVTLTGHLTLSSDSNEGLSGGGLLDCDNSTTSKLLWDATTNKFSCGTDGGSGSGSSKWTTSGSVIYPNTLSDQIGIGTTTAGDVISSFYVSRSTASTALGKAVAIFNQTESQDILTASASGTTKFSITNGGNIGFTGGTSFLNTITSAATIARTYTLPDATGTICLTTGNCAGVGGNGDITAVGSMITGDAFADINADDDWLGLGASAGRIEFDDQTTDEVNILSANVGIGTSVPLAKLDVQGVASIAGNLVFSGARSVTTEALTTLTIGGATTGNIIIDSGSSSIALSDNTAISGTLLTTGAITAPTSTNTINGLIINAGVLTGATNGTINGIDISSGTVSDVVNLTINSGGDLAIGAIGLNDVGTDNITSGASLVGVFDEFANSSATTVQDVLDDLDAAIGAGSSKWTLSSGVIYPQTISNQVGIGTTTSGNVISSLFVTRNLASGALGKSVAIFDQTESQDILTASASGTTRLTLSNSGNLNIVGGGYQIGGTSVLSSTTLGTNVVTSSLTTVGALTGGSIASGFGAIQTASTIEGTNITASGTTGFTASGAGAGLTFSGSGTHTISASTGTLQLGAATLTGTIAGGSQNITGLGTINGLAITANTGVITTGTWNGTAIGSQYGGTGQNFSSSTGVPYITSGTWATETTLDETRGGTGQTTITTGDLLYGSASNTLSKLAIGSTDQVLTVSGGIPTWSDVGSAGINYFDRANGVISPKIASVHDLLLGSNATASAKFGFINVNSGTPTATISAGTTGGIYLNASGKIATTARQSLTLGDSTTTGNVIFSQGGNVGIGTTTPTNLFSIDGGSTIQSRVTALIQGNSSSTLGNDYEGLALVNQNTTNNSYSSLGFGSYDTNGNLRTRATIAGVHTSHTTNNILTDIAFHQNGLETFRVASDGTMTLGSSSQTGDFYQTGTHNITYNGNDSGGAYSLKLRKNRAGAILQSGDDIGYVGFDGYDGSGYVRTAEVKGSIDGTPGASNDMPGRLTFLTTNDGSGTVTEKMRLDNAGNLSIGSTSPTGRLFVQGDPGGKSLANFDYTGTGFNILTASASGTTVMILDRSGNLSIEGTLADYGATSLTVDDDLQLASGKDVLLTTNTFIGLSGSAGRIVFTDSATDEIGITTANLNLNSNIITDIGVTGTDFTAAGGLTLAGTLTTSGSLVANSIATIGDGGDAITLNGSSITLTGFASCSALETNGSGVLACGIDDTSGGGSGLSKWNLNSNGTLAPINTTVDLLIGSTATAGAKFGFLNVNSGSPTATISSNFSLVVPTSTTAPDINLNVLNGGAFNFKTSVGGDEGSTSRLVITNGGALLATGDTTLGTTPASGAGSRMMWVPARSAFRAGRAISTEWDGNNIGLYSFAAGNNAAAYGQASIAMGNELSADSVNAIAIGEHLTANTFNAIVIGKGATSGSRLVNNTDSSLMVGFGSTVPTFFVGPAVSSSNTGNIGIGSTSPIGKLFVQGDPGGKSLVNLDYTGTGFNILTASSSGSTKFVITGTGNIGIGTNSPSTLLDVNSGSFTVNSGGNVGIGSTAPIGRLFVQGESVGKALVNFDYTGIGQNIITASASGTTNFVLNSSGNIGLGNGTIATAPTNKIYIDVTSGTDQGLTIRNTAGGANTAAVQLRGTSQFSTIFHRSDDDYSGFYTAATNGFTITQSGSKQVTVANGGNLGIGDSGDALSPAYKLSITETGETTNQIINVSGKGYSGVQLTADNDSTGADGSYFQASIRTAVVGIFGTVSTAGQDPIGTTTTGTLDNAIYIGSRGTSSVGLQFGTGSGSPPTVKMTLDNTGNLGIGTTSPTELLHVAGNATSSGNLTFSGARTIASRAMTTLTLGDSATGNMILNPGGNVGIGGTNTSEKVDITGNLEIDASVTTYTQRLCHSGADGATTNLKLGDCNAAGQADFAEYYGTDGTAEAGDVIMIDESKPTITLSLARIGETSKAFVKKATQSSAQKAIGIISTNPFAEVLAEGVFARDENAKAVALAGRVPVKVSSENGPIAVGDYLTVSSIPGVAMKATGAGVVVGKALENYSNSNTAAVAKIQTFVNLSYYNPTFAITPTGDFDLAEANGNYSLVNDRGETLDKKDLFSDIYVANARVGKIESENLITKAAQAVTGLFENITSNAIFTESLNINDTLSAADITATNIRLGNISLSYQDDALSFVGSDSAKLLTLDKNGDATLSGSFTAKNVYTDGITAGSAAVETLTVKNLLVENILTPNATSASILDFSDKKLTVDFAEVNFATIKTDLTVLGTTTLKDASVQENVTVGSDLTIGATKIETTTSPLEIQPLRQQAVSIMGGLLVIETDGTMKVEGEARFAKDVKVTGVLSASSIRGLGDNINVSGSATFDRIAISEKSIETESDTIVEAKGTAGLVKLKEGETQIKIKSDKVKDASLVFITPKGSTAGETLYIKEQVDGQFFIVAIENAVDRDMEFNFLIVN